MKKEKQTRRMIAMALAAAVTMSSVPVVAFAEEGGEGVPSVTTSGDGTMATPTVTVTVSPTNTTTDADGSTTAVDSTTTETQGQDQDTGASVDSTVTETVTTETNAEGNLDETNKKVVTDSNEVDENGVTTDTDITWEETKDYNNGDWVSTDGYEEGTEVVESTAENPETVSVHAVGVPTLPSDGGTTTTETVKVNDQDVEVKTTVYEEVSEDETGKRVTTTTTVVTQPKKDAEGAYVIDETTGEVVMETVTTVDRDVLLSGTGDRDTSDGEWDYRELETGREVSVTTENERIEIFTGDGNTIENVTPITSVWEGTERNITDGNGTENLPYVDVSKKQNYDVAYVGAGEDTKFGTYVEVRDAEGNVIGHSLGISSASINQFELADVVLVQKTNDDGTPVVDNDGKPVYENKITGEVYTGYCVDLSTYTQDGWWYEIKNLDDAGYYDTTREYDEEGKIVEYSDADHIRAIVKNGYWGTPSVGEKDADGEVVTEAATGSLDDVKAALNAAIDAGKLTTLTKDDVAKLTEGEASAATQMAIWKFGNGEDGEIFLNASGDGGNTAEEGAASRARIDAMYAYLITLTDVEEETEIITQDKFIKEMDFVVGDKAAGETANEDMDDTNDVYHVSLKFALVVTPGENDDLLVKVVDANNNVVTSAKIGGEDGLTPDEEGSYTLSGMKLAENSDIDFDLKLEGTQLLTEGVYIYQSEVRGTTTSQTFVGMAEGTKQVDVGAHIDLTFNVEEGTMKARHSWRKTWHDEPGGSSGGGNNDPDPKDPDPTPAPEPEDPGMIIPDEDVPLADAPDEEGIVLGAEDEAEEPMVLGEEEELIAATGDSNHMAGAFGGMFAALAGMLALRRRKEN